MKSKSEVVHLIIFGLILALVPTISTNLSFLTINSEENLKISKISEKIHIVGNSGWSDANQTGICTGNGTYSDPYVIEDLIIDAGRLESGIMIEDSDVYFRIENCTVYNSGIGWGDAGIELFRTTNGRLIDNNCSFNNYGIWLDYSDNNTILGNDANNNIEYGIRLNGNCDNNIISYNTANSNDNGIDLDNSQNNTISGNTANNNDRDGIYSHSSQNNRILGNTANNNGWNGIDLWNSINHTLSGNIMNECGLRIFGSLEELASHNIDSTNLVNGKPLYYYANEITLGLNNFTNAGQVILVNCTDSLISNLNVSYSSYGISLRFSNNNTILGATANYNDYGIYLYNSSYNTISGTTANYNNYGIYLYNSSYNTISGTTTNNNNYGIYLYNSNYNSISGNILLGNEKCIVEKNCEGNIFENNDCGSKEPAIPGYNLFILLGILSVAVILISKKLKKD